MATTQNGGADEGADEPGCARDFIRDRLRESDSPMSPAELAGEYGCTNGHIRNELADLREEGRVYRVGRGEYVDASTHDDGAEPDAEADVDPEMWPSPPGTGEDAETDAEPDPSADGGPLSEDLATEDQDDRDGGEAVVEEGGDGEVAAGAAAAGAGAGLAVLNRVPTTYLIIVGMGLVAYYFLFVVDGDGEDAEQDAATVDDTPDEDDQEASAEAGLVG